MKRKKKQLSEKVDGKTGVQTDEIKDLDMECERQNKEIQSEIEVLFFIIFLSIAVHNKQRFDNPILIRSFLYFNPVFSLLQFANAED